MTSMLRALVPGRDERVDLGFTAVLVLLTLVGFRTTYYGWAWLLDGAVGIVLALVVSQVVLARRLPGAVTGLALAVVYLLLGAPIAVREGLVGGVLPTPAAVARLADTAVFGWKQLLTSLPPVDSPGQLTALPLLFAMVGAATTYSLARRWRGAPPALAAPLSLLGLSIVLGTLTPASLALQGAAFGLVAIGWAALRAARERPPLQNGAGRATRTVTASGLLAVALVGGLLVGPHLPGSDATQRTVWRTALEPPFDVSQFPSPLAGFRKYTEPNSAELYDTVLFEVEGLPAGVPVRLATLDSFDGSVWGAGNIAAGAPAGDDAATFRRVGSHLAASGPGQEVTATVTIRDGGYSDIWLPTAGTVTGIDFAGPRRTQLADDLRFNVDTNTGVLPTRLGVGDSYRLSAIVQPAPASLPADVAVGGSPIVDTQAVSFIDAKLDAWSGDERQPWAKLRAVAAALRDGAYTDGGPAGSYQNVFLPGHSIGRLTRFVKAQQLAGDDEQYAATLALAANRLGMAARVVFGAIPPPSGQVKGADVHAWVEVRTSDGTWAAVLPQDFVPDRTKEPQQQQQRSEEKKTGAQVPPPAANNPPSVLQGPDQAQNATQKKPPSKSIFDPSTWPGWVLWLLRYVVLPLLVLLLLYAAVLAVKARRRVRRRTRGTPEARIAGGWSEVVDTAADLGIRLPRNATRLEQAAVLDARATPTMPGRPTFTVLARVADERVFAAQAPSEQDATAFWKDVAQARRALRASVPRWRRLLADVSPSSAHVRRPNRQPLGRRTGRLPVAWRRPRPS